MPLTVTPGGAADDSLITLAFFQTHCANMGYDLAAYTDTQQEIAIRKGTVYVEGLGVAVGRISSRWPGQISDGAQRRIWPRTNATFVDGVSISSDVIPAQVTEAVAEASFYELGNAGTLSALINLSKVAQKQSVGGSGLSVTYADSVEYRDARPMLLNVMDLLSGILVPDVEGPFFAFMSVG